MISLVLHPDKGAESTRFGETLLMQHRRKKGALGNRARTRWMLEGLDTCCPRRSESGMGLALAIEIVGTAYIHHLVLGRKRTPSPSEIDMVCARPVLLRIAMAFLSKGTASPERSDGTSGSVIS